MIKAITYILNNDSNVQSLLGRNEADSKYKVYPSVVPQTEIAPYIAVRKTAGVNIHKQSTDQEGQFDVYSYCKTYDETEALETEVIRALVGISGSQNSVSISFINQVNSRDDHVLIGGELLYSRVTTFQINWSETLT